MSSYLKFLNLPSTESCNLEIVIENLPNRNFFPGERIFGEVVLVNRCLQGVKSLEIMFKGEAKVRDRKWLIQRNTNSESLIQETYFSVTKLLLENDTDAIITFPPGTTRYPFTHQLPTDIPCSFIHKLGNISYSVQAIMKRSSFKPDLKVELHFTVGGLLTLTGTLLGNLTQPVQIEMTTPCCDISFTLKLTKRIYALGEFINFTVHRKNNSTRKVDHIRIKLIQIVQLTLDKTTQNKTILGEVKGPKLEGGVEDDWVGRDVLKIPVNSLPTGLGGGCCVFSLRYVLRIEVKLFWLGTYADISLILGSRVEVQQHQDNHDVVRVDNMLPIISVTEHSNVPNSSVSNNGGPPRYAFNCPAPYPLFHVPTVSLTYPLISSRPDRTDLDGLEQYESRGGCGGINDSPPRYDDAIRMRTLSMGGYYTDRNNTGR